MNPKLALFLALYPAMFCSACYVVALLWLPEEYHLFELSIIALGSLFIYRNFFVVQPIKLYCKPSSPLTKLLKKHMPILKESYKPSIWYFESQLQTMELKNFKDPCQLHLFWDNFLPKTLILNSSKYFKKLYSRSLNQQVSCCILLWSLKLTNFIYDSFEVPVE